MEENQQITNKSKPINIVMIPNKPILILCKTTVLEVKELPIKKTFL